MKEKKLKNWIRLQRKRREASRVVSGIVFTPGVPTEDGWYVVKVKLESGDYYDTLTVCGGLYSKCSNPILSHAKLPEL